MWKTDTSLQLWETEVSSNLSEPYSNKHNDAKAQGPTIKKHLTRDGYPNRYKDMEQFSKPNSSLLIYFLLLSFFFFSPKQAGLKKNTQDLNN